MSARLVKPALDRPHGLWSLWDMLEKHVFFFTNALGAFVEFKFLCAQLGKLTPEAKLPDDLRPLANSALHTLRQAYILSDLSDFMGALDRLHMSINPSVPEAEITAANIAQEVKHLISGTRDILEHQFYFHIYGQDVPFYLGGEKLFGGRVFEKLGKAAEDVAEAGKCLALQRSTACVFHLMRVMEIGVQTLGRKLKVTIDVRNETWHQIMLHVNSRIEKLPSKTVRDKNRKATLAEAAAHLQSVRLAWRNEVMHPKQTYTRQEAYDVFNATRIFISALSGLV
jgi:hypothetical protein